MSEPQKQIKAPQMCEKHRALLIHGTKFKKNDPWQILEVVSTIVLLQAASSQKVTHDKIGDDFTKIETIGCLACWCPDVFSKIVRMVKGQKKVEQFAPMLKKYGESFLAATGTGIKIADGGDDEGSSDNKM